MHKSETKINIQHNLKKVNIPFNKPYFSGKEGYNMTIAAQSGKISGNGYYTQKCHSFLEKKYSFKKVLLTTSCTDALEMSSLLIDIQPGDEVIVPSFTFVSTANAFILRGAKIVFADSEDKYPNIDAAKLEPLITKKTKAIVVVHYSGVACNMDEIMQIATKHNIFVIEDAAQAIDSYYKNKSLGSIGHLATFSFHETKNIISGEGGMLVINDENFLKRAEIIWEKGTNRAAFHRGEINKYGWVDIGSSYLPSEITAAFLFAQLEEIEDIQQKRKSIWESYFQKLKNLELQGHFDLQHIPEYATNNGHMFFLVAKNLNERVKLINFLKTNNIQAVFHYLPLHESDYYKNKHDGRPLANAIKFSNRIVRLPFYYSLEENEIDFICQKIHEFYK